MSTKFVKTTGQDRQYLTCIFLTLPLKKRSNNQIPKQELQFMKKRVIFLFKHLHLFFARTIREEINNINKKLCISPKKTFISLYNFRSAFQSKKVHLMQMLLIKTPTYHAI